MPNLEQMPAAVPQKKNDQAKDLQKEVHRLFQEESKVAALRFLLKNYDRNPEYALKHALQLSAIINEKVVQWLRFKASADELRARLYVEFRQLSDRQKTKVKGFKGYIQKYLDELKGESGEFSPEEQKFNEALLKDTERFYDPGLSEADSDRIRTTRTNYRNVSNATNAQLSSLQEGANIIREILEKSGVNKEKV